MPQKVSPPDTGQRLEVESVNDGVLQPESIPELKRKYYRPEVNWRFIIWSVFGTLVAIILLAYIQIPFPVPTDEQVPKVEVPTAILPSPTPLATPSATPSPISTRATRAFTFLEPTPTFTPVPGGSLLVLNIEARDGGWVASEDETIATIYDPQNHFGDSFLYAGVLGDKIYHGAFQFSLERIPRGTTINAATLRLTGLREDQLDPEGRGTWRVQLLATEIDYNWRAHNYKQIHEAAVWTTLEPILTPEQLEEKQVNVFEFTPEQLEFLDRRIFEGSGKISFRLDGPTQGSDNLFAWDTGSGPASNGVGPELFLSLGPPPKNTPLPYHVMITGTPTPENIMTAVANSVRMTAEATRIGTATPIPPNWITPMVVTATPLPENEATAQIMAELATAVALTTGEPRNIAIATPTPTYVIITSTPTPLSVMTAAAQALEVTAQAAQFGTATALPLNWVTPVVVTSTPTPQNTGTVEYLGAVLLTTGTPTPLPSNAQTATPTPVFIAVAPIASPTATATPSATPQPIPDVLLGKIIFLSDREGATEEELQRAGRLRATPEVIPQPYVFDPATGELARLTDIWPYLVADAREAWSADEVYETYNKLLLWTNVQVGSDYRPTEVLAIHYYDYIYNVERMVTRMGTGIVYDPAWSPTSNEIAFVATESGNDEIWVINHDGTNVRQLTRNQWEWDKHPSWSPDGQHIIFFSNRTGNSQIWIMKKDGGEQRLLMDWNPYNDWDPVWVKYLNPPPPSDRQPDWRFIKPPEDTGP